MTTSHPYLEKEVRPLSLIIADHVVLSSPFALSGKFPSTRVARHFHFVDVNVARQDG